MLTDPVEDVVTAETTRDHARAAARGQRVRDLTNSIISALDAHGILRDTLSARPIVYGVLVDDLYGNAAVDVDPRP